MGIDNDIRKFTSSIADAKIFDSFLHNKRLPPYLSRDSTSTISWPLTQAWCHYNNTQTLPANARTSWTLSRLNP